MSQDFCNHCRVITVISGGDELLRIPHTAGGLLLPFLIEENAKFQLEVSENEGITFLPTKFLDPLKSTQGPQIKNCWIRWSQPGKVRPWERGEEDDKGPKGRASLP